MNTFEQYLAESSPPRWTVIQRINAPALSAKDSFYGMIGKRAFTYRLECKLSDTERIEAYISPHEHRQVIIHTELNGVEDYDGIQHVYDYEQFVRAIKNYINTSPMSVDLKNKIYSWPTKAQYDKILNPDLFTYQNEWGDK